MSASFGNAPILRVLTRTRCRPNDEVFHRPASIRVAKAFSDPPMNLLDQGAARLGLPAGSAPADATIGLRASALRVQARAGDIALPGTVELAEISGSDTFVHVHTAAGELVAQPTGVHFFDLGAAITLHLDPAAVHVFGSDGRLLRAPERGGRREAPTLTSFAAPRGGAGLPWGGPAGGLI